MQSTVTYLFLFRLSNITIKQKIKTTIMRTLNSNQLTEKLSTSKAYLWNSKRRYRK